MAAFQHMAFVTRDIKAQEQFLTRHFGFRRARVFNAGQPNEFVILRLGGTCVELFQAAEGAREKTSSAQPMGYQHMAFTVEDIEKAVAALQADGYETEDIIDCSSMLPGMRICFFHDADGNRIELMEGYCDQSFD